MLANLRRLLPRQRRAGKYHSAAGESFPLADGEVRRKNKERLAGLEEMSGINPAPGKMHSA